MLKRGMRVNEDEVSKAHLFGQGVSEEGSRSECSRVGSKYR